MKKAFIESVNDRCLSNDYITECIRAHLKSNGFAFASSRGGADVVVVTGCNVIEINPEIARDYAVFARGNPEKTVILAGCTPKLPAAKRPGAANLHVIPYSLIVRDPVRISDAIGSKVRFGFVPAQEVLPGRVPFWAGVGADMSQLCYIRAADGCLGKCAFCAIRQAKGRVKSVPPGIIMKEFDAGLAKGYDKFWLQSDDIGCWGADLGLDLPVLLEKMTARSPSSKILLYAFSPDLYIRLFDRMRPFLKHVSFLLIPVQSGSNRLVKLMNRDYDVEKVLKLVELTKKINPGIFITTEIIVGFPTETKEEFGGSLKAAARFDAAYFSPMTVFPGTPAHKLKGQIDKAEIDRRRNIAKKVGNGLSTHEVCNPGVYFPSGPGKKAGKSKADAVLWVRNNSRVRPAVTVK